MTKRIPRIVLVTHTEKICDLFEENLRIFFDQQVEIEGYYGTSDLPLHVCERADLIIIPVQELLSLIPSCARKIPLVIARRTVDLTKLDQLMDLAPGTRCLLVSNNQVIAEDSTELLRHLGFDHLQFIPYAPGTDTPIPEADDIDIAVCHGLRELVPEHITNIIEIGHLRIDLTTILDIARILHLPVEKANLFTAEFISDFVRLGRKLTHSANQERQLNKKLEAILNAVHEGIIGTDAEGLITVLNEEAEKIMNLSATASIGRHVQDVLPEFRVNQVLLSQTEMTDHLLQIRDQYLLVTIVPTFLDDQLLGAVITFQDVTKMQRTEQEIRKKSIGLGLSTKYSFEHIIGESQSTKSNKQVALKLAESDYTILITGENGTGKEVFAQAIHQHSTRRDCPFVPVNFAGLTESLAESELFGYEEGAFTGARKGGKMGLFELAHNGTIFLDEIGDAPLGIQASLLRVLQERQVMRIGANRMIPVNVRVIAATNRNLMDMMKNGTFREDLYYRLNVLPLHIPPLRERREDLFTLIQNFLKKNKKKLAFSKEAKELLQGYNWPGNIRELENLLQYLVVIADNQLVEVRHLPGLTQKKLGQNSNGQNESIQTKDDSEPIEIISFLTGHGSLSEYQEILYQLAICYKRTETIGRATLLRMLRYPLTEAQLRSRLSLLQRLGCLSVGVKKQGTRMTPLGLKVYEVLQLREREV
ncbi:sigma-54 interaction domain-containing protein [Brevibacillus daliensis]|uniref:sigma-54 interaction domain-containing protein n=1 Tax=Brevibacillus daliensis TaxID=2892995 RepID=UPI001E34D5CC|nr:sigma 54-interacting transcriptional regulator [Brevibacillus daliensis]